MADEELLFHRQYKSNKVQRSTDLFLLSTFLSFLTYRLFHPHTSLLFHISLTCELWFTLVSALLLNCRWSPLLYSTRPHLLWWREEEKLLLLPPLDIFVTTADPLLEPPLLTVNTVLSLLSMDYPPNKLSCYVSDDAASPLTFYSLLQASHFAREWVPFCKKYNLPLRAPFRYFSPEISPPPPPGSWSPSFEDEVKKMKSMYEGLVIKLEEAARGPLELNAVDSNIFHHIDRGNHGAIIKVIWENHEGNQDGVPHLVYVSREKRPNHHHHYKAGAMNVLTRVSGVMTNAPFILNLDCDMFCNNPEVVLHAMCLLLGVDDDRECGFVQFPQYFYNSLLNAPILIANRSIFPGIGGIQGPFYMGTGCFHRRKVIYGCTAPESGMKVGNLSSHDKLSNYKLGKKFGNSVEFVKSAKEVLLGSRKWPDIIFEPSSSVDAARKVAASNYEIGTRWGIEVGLMYGSCTEDVLTGLVIHQRGWVSAFVDMEPQAFLGCAPYGGLAAMNQTKRWITGTSEILFSKHNPLIGILTADKLRFRQRLCYLWLLMRGLNGIFEHIYMALPAYCFITNSFFVPKGAASLIPLAAFSAQSLNNLSEFLRAGATPQQWWNSKRMTKIITLTAFPLGMITAVGKLILLTDPVFQVTEKTEPAPENKTEGLTFDRSALFVPGVAVVLVQVGALGIGLFRIIGSGYDPEGPGLGEVGCSVWALMCLWPICKGVVGRRRKYGHGIPLVTILKAMLLSALFFFLAYIVHPW